MESLFVLSLILLSLWLWGVWERDRRAAFMRQWLHLPFLAGVITLVMAIGSLFR